MNLSRDPTICRHAERRKGKGLCSEAYCGHRWTLRGNPEDYGDEEHYYAGAGAYCCECLEGDQIALEHSYTDLRLEAGFVRVRQSELDAEERSEAMVPPLPENPIFPGFIREYRLFLAKKELGCCSLNGAWATGWLDVRGIYYANGEMRYTHTEVLSGMMLVVMFVARLRRYAKERKAYAPGGKKHREALAEWAEMNGECPQQAKWPNSGLRRGKPLYASRREALAEPVRMNGASSQKAKWPNSALRRVK